MPVTRREFVAGTAIHLALAAEEPQFIRSICSVIFAPGTGLPQMFQQARAAGFQGIELRLDVDLAEAGQTGARARDHGIGIASLWVSKALGAHPLNSPDPAMRQKGVDDILRACDVAAAIGCGALLLVPGRVGSGPKLFAGYEDTWNRFSEELARCVSHAEQTRVLLTIENVWNKFLMSPLEMRTFVDQFHSPWVAAHFDMGNAMQFGYPEDWVRTLGRRIRRVHVKDYKLPAPGQGQGRFVPLLEGDVNFPAVIQALRETGYRGYLSPEIDFDGAQSAQLTDVAARLGRILA